MKEPWAVVLGLLFHNLVIGPAIENNITNY